MRTPCSQFVMAAFAVFLLAAGAFSAQDRSTWLMPVQPVYQAPYAEYRPPGDRLAAASPRGHAQFTGNFTDSVADDDGDGWNDQLRSVAEVEVTQKGRFQFSGWVFKSPIEYITARRGNNYASLSYRLDTFLTVGTHYLLLTFSGEDIFHSMRDGPYNIGWELLNGSAAVLDSITQVTSAYDHTVFGQPRRVGGTPTDARGSSLYGYAQLTGNFTDSVFDDDGDGWYDRLRPAAEVQVSQPGAFNFGAWLFKGEQAIANRPAWNFVNFTHFDTILPVGTHYVSLTFSGEQIYRSGEDGPYRIPWGWSSGAVGGDTVQITSAYDHTAFGELPARAPHSLTDVGLDTDGDGLYDALRCSVSVLLSRTDRYSMDGRLILGDTQTVAIAWTRMDSVGPGLVTFTLDFPGPDIWEHGLDGPYGVTVWVEYAHQEQCAEGHFVTGPYSYTDFDPPAVRLNGLPTVTPIDLGSDGLYDSLIFTLPYLADSATGTSAGPATFRIPMAGGSPPPRRSPPEGRAARPPPLQPPLPLQQTRCSPCITPAAPPPTRSPSPRQHDRCSPSSKPRSRPLLPHASPAGARPAPHRPHNATLESTGQSHFAAPPE